MNNDLPSVERDAFICVLSAFAKKNLELKQQLDDCVKDDAFWKSEYYKLFSQNSKPEKTANE